MRSRIQRKTASVAGSRVTQLICHPAMHIFMHNGRWYENSEEKQRICNIHNLYLCNGINTISQISIILQ